MKKILLLILLGISFNSFAQIATGVNNLQAFPWRTFSNPNMVGLVYDGSQYRMYGFDKYALLDTTNATGKFGTKYDLSLKTNRSQTLSINGTTYDLSANRSWTVGDILSSGSYSNPSWITSLAWSKITGTPTTVSGYGISDAVTNISLSSTLSGYATTSALTSGLATKQNSLTLTTTGTGAATLVGATLNIPTPIAPDSTVYRTVANSLSLSQAQTKLNTKQNLVSLTTTGSGAATFNQSTGSLNIPTPIIPAQYNPTAGTGISITGSYPNQTITNTAPDQTITLTAGNRISITGTYPNFTIGYIEPIINQVSRNINTNYTIGNRQATVFYSIPVTATNPLLIGTSVGTAFLEYSTNAGGSWSTAVPTSASSSVGLSVTIQLTTGGSNLLAGVVPQNALVRIRTTTSGTATVGNATGQEIY